MPTPLQMSTANLITLSRLPFLLVIAALLYHPVPWSLFTALALLPALFLMDWLDGFVARQKNQVTDLGSVLDIAVDRAVENVLWIVFAHQGLIGVWIPILFLIRSFVVDGVRSYAISRGYSAFGMMHTGWGKFLVSGRFMRGLYGLAKAGAFCALTLNQALKALDQQMAARQTWALASEHLLVGLAVALCIARGLPVLWDIRAILGPAPEK